MRRCRILHYWFFYVALQIPFAVWAQQKDSTLAEVKVSGVKNYSKASSPFPVQILQRRDIDQLNAINIADAAKYFSGVLVKDYGGIGGLKTVSVRSLGAAHTAVFYDGVMVSDAQAGQIDLGKYRIDNIAKISLFNAHPPDLLNTAKAFASASVLALQTQTGAGRQQFFRAGMNAGSFGLMQPYVSGAVALSHRWSLYGDAAYLRAENNYPFRDYVNADVKTRRRNSDIKTFNGEANLVYQNENKSRLLIKSYYYNSRRGLPSGIILYNPFSNERLADQDFFVQGSYRKNIGTGTSFLMNAKYAYLQSHYTKPATSGMIKTLDENFRQYEYFISAAVRQRLSEVFSAAWATDFFHNRLTRTDAVTTQPGFPFSFPTRNTLLSNLALKAAWERVEAQFSLLHTMVHNRVRLGKAGANLQRFSPTVSASVQPFAHIPLRLRAFYKNIFRVPTFNDLYYTAVGNTSLRPEIATQFNAGISYSMTDAGSFFRHSSFHIDFYRNRVKDKIIAVPRENLFQWSMLNLGIVTINGVDFSAETEWHPVQDLIFSLHGNYSFQQALDKTDPASVLYNRQIAYTPKHSGSFRLGASYGNFSVGYSMLFSSYRFRVGEVLQQNYLPGWWVSDVNVKYRMAFEKNIFVFFAEGNNIFNRQYDIVMYYPMPEIHFRTGIKIERNLNF